MMEGLGPSTGTLHGEDPPELIEIQENGIRFLVDVRKGHKTGFYLDQRDNRESLGKFSRGAETLNCFSYTGGFGLAAIKCGAREVTNVDSSREAVALGLKNAELNGMDQRFLTIEDDVFTVLRSMRDANKKYDLIVLDPPKFAASAKQVPGASRGYKDINLLAFKLLRPAARCSPSRARDTSPRSCSGRSLQMRRSTRCARHGSSDTWGSHPTTPLPWRFPRDTTSRASLSGRNDYSDRQRGCLHPHASNGSRGVTVCTGLTEKAPGKNRAAIMYIHARLSDANYPE
jgi:hypothetical protein